MRIRPRTWCWLGLLLCAAAALSWLCVQTTRHSHRVTPAQAAVDRLAAPSLAGPPGPGTPHPAEAGNVSRRESYRLSNTRQSEGQMRGNNHAILLRNALIDTRLPLKLDIPPQLRAKGAPGSYIVQAWQPLDGRFYDQLKQAGATFVSYIPNNAALVRATPEQAAQVAGSAMIQAVLPYEPYYKLATPLLAAAVEQQAPQTDALNVTTFPGERDAALAALVGLGAKYMSEESSPFGPTLTVMVPPDKLAEVAQLPLAREIEPFAPRRLLNDLTRVTLGVSADTLIGTSNYLNLTGSNVTVNMNDTGVDTNHPDFKGTSGLRLNTNAPYDYNGHGTFVAGIIMGNGSQSKTVTNPVPGSIIPGADFRGKATNAILDVQSLGLVVGTTVAAAFEQGGTYVSDMALEANASAQLGPTNLISNNSWGYDGVKSYDMHAASFDAATRDAQPGVPGEQPLLFVFAAGDASNGNDNGGGGAENSILSPGTAKNVITVGAVDAARFITNEVTFGSQTSNAASTNAIFFPWTDNSDLVSWFSSCGNVGPGTETLSGRFKPDVVAPGMFIISCRASSYVDPSYSTQVTPYFFGGQVVLPGHVNTNYTLAPSNFPADTQELIIEATPNSQSPAPFPPLLILGAPWPQPLGVLGTNYAQDQGTNQFVVLTTNLDGVAWDFGVASVGGQTQPVSYDLTFYLVETNDLGVSVTNASGYYHVISNLNSVLKTNYMYQYGTSMSAAAVSGMLALMQEFLQTRMDPPLTNPSPALLKALLINGSRSVNQQYDFNTQLHGLLPAGPNEQGWGLPNLPNSLPGSLTNINGGSSNAASMVLVNQSANDALATGQWQSYTVNCSDGAATNYPMRVTLVWTDPPGDPAAGLALVNNLDLLVTAGSGTNAHIWLGNDFLSGDTFTEANSGDGPDVVNNAQNVYIDSTNAPFTFPLTVTVLGARVNVNAVTTQTNEIAQDYALVISSDDPALARPLTVTSNAISSRPLIALAPFKNMTNSLGAPLLTGSLPGFAQGSAALVTAASNGAPLLDQRVGANEPNLYANGVLYTNTGTDTNGNVAQWHFFIFTNDQFNATNQATNVAFATFLAPNLATQITPRTNGADLDLYVSTDSRLTNLDPVVFATMTTNDMSLGRGGTETVIYSNSAPGEVYYVGVKSEDQQAGDFAFYAVAQQTPFGSENPDGSITFAGSAMPVPIPDSQFGQPPARVLAIASRASMGRSIRKVTVTLLIDHGNPGDLYGVFELPSEQTEQVVLNNYSGPPVGEVFSNTYNDLGDGFGGASSDGPGSLRNFMGQSIPPLWIMEETDDALLQGGQIIGFNVTVFPQPLFGGAIVTLAPNQVFFDYVVVPTDAIYLTNAVMLQSASNNPSLAIYMNTVNDLTFGDSDSTNLVFNTGSGLQTPGGYLLVSTNSAPIPLSGGTWYYGISNGGGTTITFTNQIFFGYNYTPNLVQTFTNTNMVALTTDGTTNSSQICISNGQQVLDFSVGVRLADPNLDDLVLRLTSPQGSSLVLFENRGGLLASNLGLTLTNGTSTNYIYTTFTEDTNLASVPIKFATPPYTQPVSYVLTNLSSNSFEDVAGGIYTNGQSVDGWVVAANEVSVMTEPTVAHTGSNFLALATGRLTRTFNTVPGVAYELRYYARSPGLTDWWPADNNTLDIVGTNNGVATNLTYDVGEAGRAFTFNGANSEVDFGTNISNFGTNDFTVDFWIKLPTNATGEISVLEKRPECDDLLSAWDIKCGHVWYSSATKPGQLFLEASPNGAVNTVLWVSSKPINDGIFHHVAFLRNGSNYAVYIDGILDNGSSGYSTGIADIGNSSMFRAGPSACDGVDGTTPLEGDLDELDLWQRALSPAEVDAIYAAGSLGKYSTNSLYPNFQVAFDGLLTNTVVIANFAETNWLAYTNSFVAAADQTTIELSGNTLSVLLDDVQLVQLPYTNYNNYYLPEEPLAPIIGQNPQGCWTLSIWDTRLDSSLPTNGALLSWTLQLTTSSTNVNLVVLTNGVAYNDANLPAGGIAYFGVDVPAQASFATNILFNASGPMNLLFNQGALPTGTLPGDVSLLSLASGSGSNTLAVQGAPPPLVPGQRYFLGVQNTGSGMETFRLQVNFDVTSGTNITPLSNGVPVTSGLSTNGPEFFYSFTVPANASLVTFQLLNPVGGQVNLYARDGLPLPGPMSFDYQSENAGPNDQFIVITTNSAPVPLPAPGANGVLPPAPTTWYLSVYDFGSVPNAGYTILATYVTNGGVTVISLNNQTNYTYQTNAPPGYPTNLMYSFIADANMAGVQFTVTNLSASGNVELLVGEDVYPTPEDFYIGSFNAGTSQQYVSIATNKDLPSVTNVTWYLAVPNTSGSNVSYSITATESTNGVVPSPLFLGASIASPTNGFTMYWRAVLGTTYQIEVSTDLSRWAVVTNITAQISIGSYTDSVPVLTQKSRYFRLTVP